MNLCGGSSGGNQWEGGGGKEKIPRGEEDGNTQPICTWRQHNETHLTLCEVGEVEWKYNGKGELVQGTMNAYGIIAMTSPCIINVW